jgi:hypothetical protein
LPPRTAVWSTTLNRRLPCSPALLIVAEAPQNTGLLPVAADALQLPQHVRHVRTVDADSVCSSSTTT